MGIALSASEISLKTVASESFIEKDISPAKFVQAKDFYGRFASFSKFILFFKPWFFPILFLIK
jgi:hypothetical protein